MLLGFLQETELCVAQRVSTSAPGTQLRVELLHQLLLRGVGYLPKRRYECPRASERCRSAHPIYAIARRRNAVGHLTLGKNQELSSAQIERAQFERGQHAVLRGTRAASVRLFEDNCRQAHRTRGWIQG